MAARNWFEEFPAIVAKSGATGATGATGALGPNENSELGSQRLLHLPRSQGATGATAIVTPVAPVAPVLHPPRDRHRADNIKPDQTISCSVAPVAPQKECELDLRFAYEERAAILEYDAGLSRTEAEQQARFEIYGDDPLPDIWPAFPAGWQ